MIWTKGSILNGPKPWRGHASGIAGGQDSEDLGGLHGSHLPRRRLTAMTSLLNLKRRGPASLRDLLSGEDPVLAPGCYDALSARLVEEAGFSAVYMTGFGSSASRLGSPDVCLLRLPEMVDNARRIVTAVGIPVIPDGDTGTC